MSGSLNILMTSYYMPSSSKIGVGHQVHALANSLTALGHEVTVATPSPPSEGASYRTLTLPITGSLRTFRWALVLRKLDMTAYDVLHTHGDDYWLWRSRVRAHVRTMHGSCLEEAMRVRGVKERLRMVALGLGELLATRVADTTVAVSQNTRRTMPWIPLVIPNGVDTRSFAAPATRATAPTILFVGTFHNRKRGRLLAEVFASQVRRELPAAQLWMVCSDAPAQEGVAVLGQLSEGQLRQRYLESWVFCLPSSYEGFGIPYIEALAAGLPVVATDNPGALEIARLTGAVEIVEDEALGARLVALLREGPPDGERVTRQREAARAFDLTSVAERYVDVYLALLARKAKII